jgi:hypothetical protein
MDNKKFKPDEEIIQLMFDKMRVYQINDSFTFIPNEKLKIKCNAPTDKSGVYLVFKKDQDEFLKLIYIGSSGQRNKDGTLKTRKSNLGGMKDRLVNGNHSKFGKIPRKKSWPDEMKKEGIPQLHIFWWVTHSRDFTDFPTDIEKELRTIYLTKFPVLPEWHK